MIWSATIPQEEVGRCLLCHEAPCTAACPHGLDPAGRQAGHGPRRLCGLSLVRTGLPRPRRQRLRPDRLGRRSAPDPLTREEEAT